MADDNPIYDNPIYDRDPASNTGGHGHLAP
jgi:hypothetical protein